nr:transposase [Streptomyces sp. AC512_CC834]
MKLLSASAHDADALAATLRACNRAANTASDVAFTRDLKRRNVLQEAVYHQIKADFDLGAQAAVRTVKKVCDAYAILKANLKAGNLGPEGSKRRQRAESKPIRFREGAAQPYDDRMLTWNLDRQTVSIWTVAGRLKGIPFVCSPDALRLLAFRKGESDLVVRDGMLFLLATVDVAEPPAYEPDGFLGVDLGIVNIATTSDGQIMSGRQVNRYRKRQRDLRSKLQKKRTKSAMRRLKNIRRRESRYATQRNHIIAKKLVHTAERTSRGIGLEDLSGCTRTTTAPATSPIGPMLCGSGAQSTAPERSSRSGRRGPQHGFMPRSACKPDPSGLCWRIRCVQAASSKPRRANRLMWVVPMGVPFHQVFSRWRLSPAAVRT